MHSSRNYRPLQWPSDEGVSAQGRGVCPVGGGGSEQEGVCLGGGKCLPRAV